MYRRVCEVEGALKSIPKQNAGPRKVSNSQFALFSEGESCPDRTVESVLLTGGQCVFFFTQILRWEATHGEPEKRGKKRY
jgi:hypothetical protein